MARVNTVLINWSRIGFVSIVLLGTVYHYGYDWSNHSPLAAPFFPVNESVWEHLKLGFWGLVSFSMVEYLVIRKSTHNYFFAKAIGVLTISLTIVSIYYTYTLFTRSNNLFVDISSFVVGVMLAQYWSYRISRWPHSSRRNTLGIILLVIIALVLFIFTYWPPHADIFLDHQTNTYGMSSP